nr:hypothetical protein [Tanacetum cinerariifolium]
MTKSRPQETDPWDPPRGRSRTRGLNTSRGDHPKDMERFRSVGESYDDSFFYSYRDGNRSRHMKRRRDNKSQLSSVSRSDSSDGRYRRLRSKRYKPMGEDDLTKPWMCEEEDPFTLRICNFKSSRRTRMPNNVKTYDGTGDPKDHVKIFQAAAQSINSYNDLKAAFLAYFIQQKKYVKDSVEIHNIKQNDGETIEDFMERFKVETGRMKGAPEWEAAFASKKKGHASWKAHDQTPKEILAAEAGKFQPPSPMVTPVEKRSSNKFCDFHNDKGHNTDECMQQKKQIEELVRAGKLSHLIKEIKHGRDQSKTGKETAAKDKPTAIYMIQSWQRTTRQKVTQIFERVKEITFPPLAASSGTEGSLVIEAEMGGYIIHRMYVDGGSSMEILYEHCFNRLRSEIKSQMVLATTSLTGFSSETIWPLGQLRLLVIIGDTNHSTRAWMNFMIVRSLSPYNGIIERPGIREIQAVSSTVHGMLKFPVEGGIVTIPSTVLIPTECTSVITSSAVSREEKTRPANFKVALHPDFPDQEVAIEGMLSDKGRTELCSILKKNLDIFAWQPSDMTGVPRSVAEHWLNIQEGYSPVRQKKKGQPPNVLKPYKQSSKNWLPPDQLAETDEEKTAFHTRQGVYCYTKMPFGLKNAGATYQRLMDKAFESQVGRNIEVYVDDLVVKSYTEAKMMRDIKETFRTLRKFNMKLNPKKCSFGLAEGMFLGYVVTPEGIKPCPNKTAAVLQLPSPRTIKEFATSNNEAEYEALIAGLRIAARMGVKDVHVSIDSKLVANQVLGTYVAKEDNMVKYLEIVKSLVSGFTTFSISAGRNTQRQIYKREGGGNSDRGGLTDLDDTDSGLFKRRNSPRRQEGGKKAPPQGPTIRVNGGNSLQTVVPYAVAKVCWTAPGGICDERNS